MSESRQEPYRHWRDARARAGAGRILTCQDLALVAGTGAAESLHPQARISCRRLRTGWQAADPRSA